MPPITTWACKQCGKMMQPLERWWIVARMPSIRGPIFLLGELKSPPGAGEDVVCSPHCGCKRLIQFMNHPNGAEK